MAAREKPRIATDDTGGVAWRAATRTHVPACINGAQPAKPGAQARVPLFPPRRAHPRAHARDRDEVGDRHRGQVEQLAQALRQPSQPEDVVEAAAELKRGAPAKEPREHAGPLRPRGEPSDENPDEARRVVGEQQRAHGRRELHAVLHQAAGEDEQEKLHEPFLRHGAVRGPQGAGRPRGRAQVCVGRRESECGCGTCRPSANAKYKTGNPTSWEKVPRTTRHRGYPSVHSADRKGAVGGSARIGERALERACSSPSPNSLLATGRRRVASQAHQTAVASSAVWFIGPYSRRLLRSSRSRRRPLYRRQDRQTPERGR